MAAGNFPRCHAVTAKWEGGWSDHPADPGGKTMYGVTEATYHAWLRAHNRPIKPVRSITLVEAELIYRSNYWDMLRCETLAPGVDLAVYDAGVNSGPGRANQWFKASIGGSDVQTVKNICKKRLGFVQALRTWKTFGKGWSRRVADIEAKGVAWATAAVTNKNVTKITLDRESQRAGSKASTQSVSGAATGGTGAVVMPEVADQVAAGSLIVFFTIVAVVAVVLFWRAKINSDRAEAYAAEAWKI